MSILFGIAFLALLAFCAWREREWRGEREMLLQRLQAPEKASTEFMVRQGKREPIPTLPYDDDAAYRAVKQRREMSNGSD